MIRRMSKRELAMMRLGPLEIQDRLATAGFEVAPDIVALECDQQLCGELDGYGPAAGEGVTVAIRRRAGSQLVLVPREIAMQCRGLVGTAVTVRRRRNGRYDVKSRRPRAKDSVIYRRQVIADARAQSAEVAQALRASGISHSRRRG